MTRVRHPSAQTTAVVLALADKPTAWRYGAELCQQLDLRPGSMSDPGVAGRPGPAGEHLGHQRPRRQAAPSPLSYDPATESAAKVNQEFALLLAVPTALWVTAALTVVEHWWSRTGVRRFAIDPPGRLLAAAVATLPDHRREWGWR